MELLHVWGGRRREGHIQGLRTRAWRWQGGAMICVPTLCKHLAGTLWAFFLQVPFNRTQIQQSWKTLLRGC